MSSFFERMTILQGDMKDAEFARKTGVSSPTLKRYEDGSLPSIAIASKIADAFSVSLDWLCARTDVGQPGNIVQLHDISSENQNGFISLPFIDVEASAGLGTAFPVHEGVQSVVSFERAFLRSMGARPDHCIIITARGDSMTPTIPDGSLIVIDHSQRDVVNGWISVVKVYGDLLVKRVRRRLDGTIELVSDNPIYPVEAVSADKADQLIVIGRVVYFCRAP